ncbi:MAG: FtsW/RodA/SpoVE family cell cycle protein, partial [Traorella sp.]
MKRTYLLSILLIVCIGLVEVYSASTMWAQFKYADPFYFVKRQIVFAIIGIICFFIMSRINLEQLRKYHFLILIISFISMVLVLIPGIGVERNGSRSWFQVMGIYVQPSEFLKFSLILYSAHFLASKKRVDSLFKDLSGLILLVCISFLLIMLQPDFGSG